MPIIMLPSTTMLCFFFFFFSSRRRHTRCSRDWSSDVCSSDLYNWLHRPVKVTSYCWNGTIGGYVGTKGGPLTPDGRTFKTTSFLAMDWQFWEQNESDWFYFNDAGNDPTSIGETISLRHAGIAAWWTQPILTARNLKGGALVGMFDGHGGLVRWSKCHDLVTGKIPPPNDILNGPRYR